jgi:twitching motility protein PilT
MAEYESELSKLVDQLNRSATNGKASERRSLDQLLTVAIRRNASDIILVAGSPVTLRLNGALTPDTTTPLLSEDIRNLLLPLLTPAQSAELHEQRSLDFCFVRESIGRFRANFHHQRGTLAAAIRLLPEQVPSLESLHLPPALAMLTERRQGLVLLTGPTGSGKSSTLAALVDRINARRHDHIITIEDPIEYQHTNRNSLVEQIELGHDTPNFAKAVRSVLRQDPDVIMVGEIRDSETAEIAIQAALTGHLVFSTLHTNDSFGAVTRLVDMGIEPFLVSSSILAVLAQRLVRRLCPDCREAYRPSETELARIGLKSLDSSAKVCRPKGCRNCRNTGYRGRMAIQELMIMDDEIRSLVMQNADAATLRRKCTSQGMTLLRQDGAARVLRGETSIEELLRVTQEDID